MLHPDPPTLKLIPAKPIDLDALKTSRYQPPRLTENELARQTNDLTMQALACGLSILEANFAAIYLLDADTRYLTLGPFGGAQTELANIGVRMLQQATADLEALTGHVVTLTTADRVKQCNAPMDAASAVCVPLVAQDTPIGTLWFSFDSPRVLDDSELMLIELIAAMSANYFTAIFNGGNHLVDDQLIQIAQHWQESRRLPIHCSHAMWLVQGWHLDDATISRNYYDCQETEHGISASLAHSQGGSLEALLSIGVVGNTLQRMVAVTTDPAEILERTNSCIWEGAAGEQFADVLQFALDADTGRVIYSCAGEMILLVVTPSGIEVLENISPEIGIMDYGEYENRCHIMQPGDFLVASTECGFNRDGNWVDELQAITSALKSKMTVEKLIASIESIQCDHERQHSTSWVKNDPAMLVMQYVG
ncbi:MAG: SpoIIE family protein phosphatase [Planctomycetaceae bacterium]|nr:SpoIIE family protein phosphatase [Planctomycetaceae bacterium]